MSQDDEGPGVLSAGAEPVPAPAHRVVSGSVAAEPEGLRHWVVGGRELVGRLHVQVRDRLWHTLPLEAARTRVDVSGGRVTLVTTGRIRTAELACDVSLRVVAEDGLDADLRVEFVGRSTYNRIGLCLLLAPAELCGSRLVVFRGDDEVARTTVARDVVPQLRRDGLPASFLPPFDRLSAKLAAGGTLAVTCSGDLFEIEDQRNWSDDSFKVYSTPLGLGFPRSADAGTALRQRVHVAVTGPFRPAGAEPDLGALALDRMVGVGPLPSVGTVADPATAPGVEGTGLTHLLLRPGAGPARFVGAIRGALSADPEPGAILSLPDRWVDLNRDRPDVPPGAGVLVPINGSVHVADDESVRSTVRTHRTIVAQTAATYPGRDVHVGPVDFAAAPGEWPPGPFPPPPSESDPGDPRRRWSFAAAWVASSVAAVLPARPASLTYLGLDALRVDGRATPAGRVLAWLSACVGRQTHVAAGGCRQGLPAGVAALAWPAGDGRPWDVLLANGGEDAAQVRVPGAGGPASVVLLPGGVVATRGWLA